MARETSSRFVRIAPLGGSHLATQLAVLLPVLAVAGLSAWLGLAPSAKGQSGATPAATMAATPVSPQSAPVADETNPPVPTALGEVPPVIGLKISSQSWRRGGLGSNALVTFTLRNDNDYAVKDIEIACAFARRDGSHLTDRKRIIADTVNMKSRKIFAHMHIGFVNIYANKAKCAPVAANRI